MVFNTSPAHFLFHIWPQLLRAAGTSKNTHAGNHLQPSRCSLSYSLPALLGPALPYGLKRCTPIHKQGEPSAKHANFLGQQASTLWTLVPKTCRLNGLKASSAELHHLSRTSPELVNNWHKWDRDQESCSKSAASGAPSTFLFLSQLQIINTIWVVHCN